MRSPFCMPRMKGSRRTRKSNRLTPMSLLDRFREAVFRLIMLSALSKAASSSNSTGPAREGTKYSEAAAQKSTYYYYNAHEPHHSEAVADCIEFIKRSAIADDDNRSSTGSCSNIDDGGDMVRPLPVM